VGNSEKYSHVVEQSRNVGRKTDSHLIELLLNIEHLPGKYGFLDLQFLFLSDVRCEPEPVAGADLRFLEIHEGGERFRPVEVRAEVGQFLRDV